MRTFQHITFLLRRPGIHAGSSLDEGTVTMSFSLSAPRCCPFNNSPLSFSMDRSTMSKNKHTMPCSRQASGVTHVAGRVMTVRGTDSENGGRHQSSPRSGHTGTGSIVPGIPGYAGDFAAFSPYRAGYTVIFHEYSDIPAHAIVRYIQ